MYQGLVFSYVTYIENDDVHYVTDETEWKNLLAKLIIFQK
jgi:hypothetical protein